jgi:hypothetical protein
MTSSGIWLANIFSANSTRRQFAATNQRQHFVDWFDVHQAG